MVPPRHRPSDNSEARGGAAADSMSEADAKKCLDQDLKEFFAVRDLDEVEHYVQMLMPEHRFRLVDQKAFLSVRSHPQYPGQDHLRICPFSNNSIRLFLGGLATI